MRYLTHPYIYLPSLVTTTAHATTESVQLKFILDPSFTLLTPRVMRRRVLGSSDCFELIYVIAIFPACPIGEVAS